MTPTSSLLDELGVLMIFDALLTILLYCINGSPLVEYYRFPRAALIAATTNSSCATTMGFLLYGARGRCAVKSWDVTFLMRWPLAGIVWEWIKGYRLFTIGR